MIIEISRDIIFAYCLKTDCGDLGIQINKKNRRIFEQRHFLARNYLLTTFLLIIYAARLVKNDVPSCKQHQLNIHTHNLANKFSFVQCSKDQFSEIGNLARIEGKLKRKAHKAYK